MPHRPDVPCAGCGELIWRGSTSLPPGEATCRSCRRKQSLALVAAVAARRVVPRPKVKRIYKPKGSTTERGYGQAHRLVREALLGVFIVGTPCPMCAQPMLADDPLDLDHSDPASRLRGDPGDRLTHRACNRRTNWRGGPSQAVCEICGGKYRAHAGQRTCGRACGWELRRRNRAA